MEEAMGVAAVAGALGVRYVRTDRDGLSHEAMDCRGRYDRDHRASNSASTHEPPHWILDTGATDHLT